MKKNIYLNIICTVLCQITTIISGLIVPRILLGTFGSELNGLVTSLTQLLNYISLLEGGLGSVVLAALYGPLADKDDILLNQVLKAADAFFKQIAVVFIGYVLFLGITYPFAVKSSFSPVYIFTMTVILAIGLFVQYFFSITYKLLLQADQKVYIIQLVQIVTTVINVVLMIVLTRISSELRVVKLGSALIFAIVPVFYTKYVASHYNVDLKVKVDKKVLPERWACFGQNLAFFIHNNTDTVVLTLFSDLKNVSIYSIYLLVVQSLKNFLLSLSNAFAPLMGKALAQRDIAEANKVLNIYEFLMFNVATIVFGCCFVLLPSFVMLYTNNVTDANYYQPFFSAILVVAEFIYCIRTPYIDIVYTAGKFKETARSAYIEAFLNIAISVVLVFRLGLVGIALGTLVGMLYRTIYQVRYISQNIIYREMKFFFKRSFVSVVVFITALAILSRIKFSFSGTAFSWIKNGVICLIVFVVCDVLMNILFDRKNVEYLVKKARK